MKKIYLSLLALAMFNLYKAQTLTATGNVPVVGDTEMRKAYDSAGTVPKNTGTGLSWNFSAFTLNTQTLNSVYTSTTGAPSASAFPGATIVEDIGGGKYNYWKSVTTPTTQYELAGVIVSGLNITYSNTGVYLIWPASFGYNNTDTYCGPVSGAQSGTADGTITVTGTGTGSLTLPGGTQFTNILQLKVVNKTNLVLTGPPSTITVSGTDYYYYHSSQKFPLLTVSYESSTGNPSTASITVNNAVITGLNEKNFDATFQIFPNPAKDAFNVKLTNTNSDNGVMEIFNAMGQLTKSIKLGNASTIEQNISLQDLRNGIYTVKTTLGNRISIRKLIVE